MVAVEGVWWEQRRRGRGGGIRRRAKRTVGSCGGTPGLAQEAQEAQGSARSQCMRSRRTDGLACSRAAATGRSRACPEKAQRRGQSRRQGGRRAARGLSAARLLPRRAEKASLPLPQALSPTRRRARENYSTGSGQAVLDAAKAASRGQQHDVRAQKLLLCTKSAVWQQERQRRSWTDRNAGLPSWPQRAARQGEATVGPLALARWTEAAFMKQTTLSGVLIRTENAGNAGLSAS